MNATSRAILQTVLSTDSSLSPVEQNAVRDLVRGRTEAKVESGAFDGEHLLITRKKATSLLAVSRVRIWRMTRDAILHPVEVIPGTWRYSFREIALMAQQGAVPLNASPPHPPTAAPLTAAQNPNLFSRKAT